jgi:hypothetical protein
VFLWSQLRHVLSNGLGLAKAQAPVALDSSEQMSSVVEEEHLYGCCSPRGPLSPPNGAVASEREGMVMIAAQALDNELSADADAGVCPSPETGRHVVAKSGVSTPVVGTHVSLSHESGEQVVAKSGELTPVSASSPP